MWRKMGLGAVLASSAVALSGCVVFMAPPTAKRKHGSIIITVKGCASQDSGNPSGSCKKQGHSHANAVTGHGKDQQVFLGFRVPKGSRGAKSFAGNSGPIPGGGKLKFTSSKSYTAQLQNHDPAPAGQHWVGYASQFFAYNSTSGEQNFTAKIPFSLPKGLKGSFHFVAVIGGRVGFRTTSTIHCGKSLTKLSLTSKHAIICVDDSASGTG